MICLKAKKIVSVVLLAHCMMRRKSKKVQLYQLDLVIFELLHYTQNFEGEVYKMYMI